MPMFAYHAIDERGEYFEGPENADNPEDVVTRARCRGSRVTQVYLQLSPELPFRPLFGSECFPLPEFLTHRDGQLRFADRETRQRLRELIRSGEIRGTVRWLTKRIQIRTATLMARFRRLAEECCSRGLEEGLRAGPPLKVSKEDQAAFLALKKKEMLELGTLEPEMLEGIEMLERELRGADAESRALLMPRVERSATLKSRSGAELTVERRDRWYREDSRCRSAIVDAVSNQGDDPAPIWRLTHLVLVECARHGLHGLRTRPHEARRLGCRGSNQYPDDRIEILTREGEIADSQDCRNTLVDLMREILGCAFGLDPTEAPPQEGKRLMVISGETYEARARIGVTAAGETLDVGWTRLAGSPSTPSSEPSTLGAR